MKQEAHYVQTRPMFKECEIWWCSLGANIGDEQDGKGRSFARPVLVFKKFNKHIFLGIPLSTQVKDNRFYHHLHFNNKDQCLLLSQIRLFDAKRFGIKMGEISADEVTKIREKLAQLIL